MKPGLPMPPVYPPWPSGRLSRFGEASVERPEMIWIPPGAFTMGSPEAEKQRARAEGPLTHVVLRFGFWLGKYEVTQGQYMAVMGSNPSYFNGDLNRPADNVSWYEAMQYCARLNKELALPGRSPGAWAYRLPTEAEWEYAARAGTTTRFHFGEDPDYAELDKYAWHYGNSFADSPLIQVLHGRHGGHHSGTHAVGAKRANPWGLFDLYGNVEEWCGDWWRNALPGGEVIDPLGPSSGRYRVMRGGSWRQTGRDCRSSSRDHAWPDYRGKGTTGFRLVWGPMLTAER